MQKDLRRLAGKTFVHGFVKGLGAPGMLNALNAMPAIPNLEPVKAPKTPVHVALATDWYKVGKDIDCVIEQHDKGTATAKT
ncbi:hypothetical protein ACI2S5_08370 [Ralstonia nicotianae]|uniref:hypothetical protein n=1 Tax=Ralstonia pseudosolanacearum TaxID=1310165 RepID=UPI0008F85FBD|nr:hypothetical protein [Ralstonia pseudosolanacearum]KAF3461403.1 hypothetical protein GO278_001970 [Ralstonia solanacearum]NKA06884.1 hypothetical protein [Ralstonia solanacearum]NKA78857.1 hypothetical protein [Ralstonia solanacearum]NKF99200.1 hypothetical protein [Ralstonia solanacearum]NKG03981.1 hypothetical protein [Ralstonia solanacearum]